MRMSRRIATAVAVAAIAGTTTLVGAPAQAATLGSRPLAALLPATDKFDNNPNIDTVETVLLYHVVLGDPIQAYQARRANGAVITTAEGGTITVKTRGKYDIQLVDADPLGANPWVVYYDVNVGNNQIAHGISQVLLPIAD